MKTFFDILTAICLIITALPAVILLWHRKGLKPCWETRHKKFSFWLSIILLLGTATVLYGSFIEPRLLIVNYQTIELEKIGQPIKIAFVADTQVGKYKQAEFIKKLVQKIIELKPDMVLLGGDQIDNEIYDPRELSYLEPLKELAQKIPVYAVNGNHEYGICWDDSEKNTKYSGADMSLETKKAMEGLSINYLVNEIEKINLNGQEFYLFGADEYWAKKMDFKPILQIKDDLPIIALIHNPGFMEIAHPMADLFLCGHTHGGQVRLPFIGPIMNSNDNLPKKYYQGLHDYLGAKIFITSGAGETGARARLFNPPEIVLLTIK